MAFEDASFLRQYINESGSNPDIRPETAPQESWTWTRDTVLAPAFNAAVATPINAVASTIDGLTQSKVCGRVKEMHAAPAEFGSNTWWIQNIASGLAMTLPYAIAGKVAGFGLRSAGAKCAAKGLAANMLRSEVTASVVGAGIYDAMRETKHGETRIGNSLAGIAGFAVFSYGGQITHGLRPAQRILGNIGIGAAGGTLQAIVSDGVSNGRLASKEVLLQSAVSGAAMNVLLPPMQHKLGEAFDAVDINLGLGLPIDRLIKRDAGLARAVSQSSTLRGLVDENPWARVQPDSDKSSAAGEKISLDAALEKAARPQVLGHELDHSQAQRGYANDALINHSRNLLASDPQAAWEAFREARIAHEVAARRTENRIAAELGRERQTVDPEAIRRNLAAEEIAPGLTYEDLWRQEFAAFAETDGTTLPGEDFKRPPRRRKPREKGTGDPALWPASELDSFWPRLSEEQKIRQLQDIGSGTKRATDAEKMDLALRAILHGRPSQSVIDAALQIVPEHLRSLARLEEPIYEGAERTWRDVASKRRKLDAASLGELVSFAGEAPPLVRLQLFAEYTKSTGGTAVDHTMLGPAETIYAWAQRRNPNLEHLPEELRLDGLREVLNSSANSGSSPERSLARDLAAIPRDQRVEAIALCRKNLRVHSNWSETIKPMFDLIPEASRANVAIDLLSGRTPNAESMGMQPAQAEQWLAVHREVNERRQPSFVTEALSLIPDSRLFDVYEATLPTTPVDSVLQVAREAQRRAGGQMTERMVDSILRYPDEQRRIELLGMVTLGGDTGKTFELLNGLTARRKSALAKQVVEEMYSINPHDAGAVLAVEINGLQPGQLPSKLFQEVRSGLTPEQWHEVVFSGVESAADRANLWQLRSDYPDVYERFAGDYYTLRSEVTTSGAQLLADWKLSGDFGSAVRQAIGDGRLNAGACVALREIVRHTTPEQVQAVLPELKLSLITSTFEQNRYRYRNGTPIPLSEHMVGLQNAIPELSNLRSLNLQSESQSTSAIVSDLFELVPAEHRIEAVDAVLAGDTQRAVGPEGWVSIAKDVYRSESGKFIGAMFDRALTPQQQTQLISRAIQRTDLNFLHEAVFEKPDMLRQVADAIRAVPDQAARTKLLEGIGIGQLYRMSPGLAEQTAVDLFTQLAADNPGSPVLHDWWTASARRGDWWTPDHVSYQAERRRVIAHLTETLPTETLLSIAFEAGAREPARQLLEKDPELFKYVASQTAELRTTWEHSRYSHWDYTAADQEVARTTPQLQLLNMALQFDRSVPTAQQLRSMIDGVPSSLLLTDITARLLAFQATREGPHVTAEIVQELGKYLLLNPDEAGRKMEFATDVAQAIGNIDPTVDRSLFFRAVNDFLTSGEIDYSRKLKFARDLAEYIREKGRDEIDFELPSLRMPVDHSITPEQQQAARAVLESSLRDPARIRSLFGDGLLGQLFPRVFGEGEGIVNRPQGGGHQFPLHEHIARAVENVNKDPWFENLPPKEQTDVLIAMLLHDVGKRPGGRDPDHEWVGANIAHGVLLSLGYEPQRVQRIANLISRHSDVSYAPGRNTIASLQGEKADRGLITHYRRPGDAQRLRIMNRSDIGAIDAEGSYLSDDVARELDRITDVLDQRQKELNKNAVPILTSTLPRDFGLYRAPDGYVLLGHHSGYLTAGTFLRQRSVIESPEYSMSTSVMTPKHLRFFRGRQDGLVAIVAAPQEHISQAYRDNLSTGYGVGLDRHIRLTADWAHKTQSAEFAGEIDSKLGQLADQLEPPGTVPAEGAVRPVKSLAELWDRLSAYDTVDDLLAAEGRESPTYKAYSVVVNAMTHQANGARLDHHNEVKVHHPTIVGIGIVRKGKNVVFENADASVQRSLLGDSSAPEWLSFSEKSGDAIVVPEATWREALSDNLPFIALD